MKLAQARQGQVVRNTSNHSHYRYVRPEKSRIRIRPLELFPNGLLIEKPTDTLVGADLEVLLIGMWCVGMIVEGHPTHGRKTYVTELERREAELEVLRTQYETLPTDGKGKLSKGSWANKIKSCEARIATLRLGLQEITTAALHVQEEDRSPVFSANAYVLLPSGRPGVITEMLEGQAQVFTRHAGQEVSAIVPTDILRPWSQSRVCTSW